MTSSSLNSTLTRLEELKKRFDPKVSVLIEKLIPRLARVQFRDGEELVRYHELLLFLLAYPQNSRILSLADNELASFPQRVESLRLLQEDISSLESPEISGIAGTSVTDTFTYPIMRWLVGHKQGSADFYWDWFEDENRLGETWPRFMPLLEEDASVEAHVPYQDWLYAATGERASLPWLINQFANLQKSEKEKAELYNSLQLYVRWTPSYAASRTGMRLKRTKKFYHRGPLIQRRDVSLSLELNQPTAPLQLLSAAQGEAMLDLAREASTTRYRELYGFTHGDNSRVFKAEPGRGVELYITGLPPDRRLPLRAYHAAMIFKNGVAIGYFEGLSLFERMESGFNLYYTFRDGETAWLYAKVLNVFRHLAGVTAFSLDPYQIGHENEEGIESGAFWFYRKLGFRPTSPAIMKLVLKEEERMAKSPGYRTPARTLRKLAAGPMIFESDASTSGDWDRFHLRNIGFAAQRRMAERYGGDAEKIRKESVAHLTKVLGLGRSDLRAFELPALSDFAATLSLIEGLGRWSKDEKEGLARIIRAKALADESAYLMLMQKHDRLRQAFINLGSNQEQNDPRKHTN